MARVQLEDRICADPECDESFTPIRRTQLFHAEACRKRYWSKAYHWTPHPCPLCTVRHDPEEAPILDALERIMRTCDDAVGPDSYDNLHAEVEMMIARRRGILAGLPVALAVE